MVKGRRTGARGLARGVFAFFWIVLAGFSGLYLFTLFTDPAALGGETFQLSAIVGDAAPSAPGPAADAPPVAPARAPVQAKQDTLTAAEVASLQQSLQGVSQQIAQLDARLKPIERFVGPVAALPPSASVTTSPPEPQAAPTSEADVAAPAPGAVAPPEPAAEEPVEDVIEETEVAETEIEAPAETEIEAPAEPEPQAAAAPPPAPEPEPQAAMPPVAVTDDPEMPVETESQAAAPTGEIAALDPVTLPPAANDGSTRYGIEIGSVKSSDDLRPLWRELLTKHAALVAGLQPRRVKAQDDTWRLIAGPFADAADAEGACTLFKKADRPCAATVFAGDAL